MAEMTLTEKKLREEWMEASQKEAPVARQSTSRTAQSFMPQERRPVSTLIHPRFDTVIRKCADRLDTEDVTPQLLVGLLFRHSRKTPYPNMLLSDWLWAEAIRQSRPQENSGVEYDGKIMTRPQRELHSLLKQFKTETQRLASMHGISELAAARSVLNDSEYPLPCVFRACVAGRLEMTSTARRFGRRAWLEITSRPHYYWPAWRELLPASWRQVLEKGSR